MQGDPFDGRIEGGRLYGRGSYDMKGGLAAILGAAAALRDQPLAGDLWLGFVTDEEYASIGMRRARPADPPRRRDPDRTDRRRNRAGP